MTAAHIRQLHEDGYCVLRGRLPLRAIEDCRAAFWPVLLAYLDAHGGQPNRGPHRHYLPMPFEPPCFAPEFFFDPEILAIVRGVLGDRIVADQWGCDVPVRGSTHQEWHIDFRRPLFEEVPALALPPYMLCVSFGLVPIGAENGAIEIASKAIPLELGDVLIRNPWTLHRGSPNTTDTPRPLVTIRYVRRWYCDDSREVCAIGRKMWQGLTAEQQRLLRFPVRD